MRRRPRVRRRARSTETAPRPAPCRAAVRHPAAAIRYAARARRRQPAKSRQRYGTGSFDLLREFFGLVLLVQGADELIEVAVDDVIEFVEREVDAVVGDAALRESIRADARGPSAGTDVKLPRLRLLAFLFFSFGGQHAGLEQRQRA